MLKDKINGFYRDSFQDRERSYFYVSDVGKCPRALYFNFKDAPREKPDPRILRIFDEGHYTHRRLMSVLFSLGIVQAVEINTPPNDLIHGRADAIITLDNKPYVLELKSSAGFKFKKLDQPQDKHYQQLQLYMHYFQIPQGIVLYENKNTQHLKEFELKYEEGRVENILAGFRFLKEQIDKDVLPEKPDRIKKWQCRYCDYRQECQRLSSA